MEQMYNATPDDPWYVDPTDTVAVMEFVQYHIAASINCTHGKGFTYDFCPLQNGNFNKAIEHLKAQK